MISNKGCPLWTAFICFQHFNDLKFLSKTTSVKHYSDEHLSFHKKIGSTIYLNFYPKANSMQCFKSYKTYLFNENNL